MQIVSKRLQPGGQADAVSHWRDIAPQWSRVGPPLRPSSQDLGFCATAIDGWMRRHGAPRTVILGVTPELYDLCRPIDAHVLAVDRSQSMIDTVWPGPPQQVIRADWTDMPLPTASRDLVFCDGGIHLLAYPQAHRQLVSQLRRIVAANGLCIFRLFVPPAEPESPATVLQDLLAGRISSLNVLKLRLGMALQEASEGGVELGYVWDVLHQLEPDFARLAARAGWPLDDLLPIHSYRDCPARYHFLSGVEVCRLFCDDLGGFEVYSSQEPSYELGSRCPTIVLRRLSRP